MKKGFILSITVTFTSIISSGVTPERKNGVTKSSFYNIAMVNLRDEILNGDVIIAEDQYAISINILDRMLFNFNKTDLKPESYSVLEKIGGILKDVPDAKMIQIEGYPEDQSIDRKLKTTIPNNWALGAIHAITITRYLSENLKINPKKLSVLSFSQYRPIMITTSAENMVKYRRIEIVISKQNIYQEIEMNNDYCSN